MLTVLNTQNQCQRLCELNAEFQPIDWLRYALYQKVNAVESWIIKQQDHRIELHRQGDEYLLLLWVHKSTCVPMDNIKPQWDASTFTQSIIAQNTEFPNALLWAPTPSHEWSSLWLATEWWPLEGITDAIDAPQKWISWWWFEAMEFTTPAPSLYDNNLTLTQL